MPRKVAAKTLTGNLIKVQQASQHKTTEHTCTHHLCIFFGCNSSSSSRCLSAHWESCKAAWREKVRDS